MNTDDLLKHITQTELSRGNLSDAEKTALHASIMSRVSPAPAKIVRSPYRSYLHMAIRMSAAFVLIFGIGMMGTTYASADALPGEFLYKFKVTVREPLIALTKKTDADRDAYALARVEERYREIAMLAKQDALTKERGGEALAYLKEQTNDVASRAKDKPVATDTKAVTTYLASSRTASSTIAAHGKALATVSIAKTNTDAQSIIREAQEVATEGVESIASSTHEVIESIPAKDVAVLAVSDLEPQVAAVSETSVKASATIAIPAVMKTSMMIVETGNAENVVDATVDDIEVLMQKLETTMQDVGLQKTLSDDETDTITKLYEAALEAKEAGDYTKALELLHKALSTYDTNQKTIEVENEIKTTVRVQASSSESSIMSDKGSASAVSSVSR